MTNSQELSDFLRSYEKCTNTHVFDNVAPLIADDATYWFSDGAHRGKDAIRRAFEKTWSAIKNETYTLHDLRWVAVSDSIAVCIYSFHWKGLVDDNEEMGHGKGTNVLIKTEDSWKIVHEHLST